ncbi:MAG: hypothetical protein IJ752_04420 [Alphaproteobacteria bacterium]|nr:hypothetical protein [Alphaproteobacteria bacterium]
MSFPFFTCGGWFYWVDRYSYSGWRIQESIWTRRCRLLDPFNIKRAAGSFELCYDTLLYFLRAWEADTQVKKGVVLIHGLFQRPSSFEKMAHHLQKNFEPIIFSYPMFRFSLVKSAMALNAMLDRRQDLKQVNFVAYGMGGLILRQALMLNPAWLEKIGRSVFLAVPNNGYVWAQKWKDRKWYQKLLGEAGKNILPETAKELFPMGGDFGVILAGKDDGKGFLPFFKEDNDGILPVKDGRCEKAREEFMALNKTHFFLHQDDKLIEMTHSFLNTGKFGRGVRIRKEQSYTNLWDN